MLVGGGHVDMLPLFLDEDIYSVIRWQWNSHEQECSMVATCKACRDFAISLLTHAAQEERRRRFVPPSVLLGALRGNLIEPFTLSVCPGDKAVVWREDGVVNVEVGTAAAAAMVLLNGKVAVTDLDNHRSCGDEARALADAMKVAGSLTKISATNFLCNEGATILCNALSESKVTQVQELGLSRNRIGPDGAKAVAAMVTAAGSLTAVR